MTQDDMFAVRTRYDEMRESCRKYHNDHPKVWELFVKFTLQMIRRGFEHYSVNGVFERIRWETDQARVDPKVAFKISNNHRPFYARRFHKAYPQHDGFFRLHEQTR